ncbi:MAG: T9SS type A sorting domain-containing protein, partial [Flavobacteriaceae bacterium]|nr:T9SS type A sorting domain-containing protein [Flavobacteriaceae bacterium]
IEIDYSIDGVSQSPFSWNGNLNIDEETIIVLPEINKTAIKKYELIVNGIVTNDGDSSNNTLMSFFKINNSSDTPTQVNTFNFFHLNWLSYNESDENILWVIDEPSKTNLNKVTSGVRAYVTHATNNYPNETKAYLISPCYDLTGIDSPIIKFNMAFELQENFDIIYVEYSVDNTNWVILGKASDPNWYNSDRIFESAEISNDCQNCPGAQWTGSNSEFNEYSFDLSELANESNIIFRFVFHSDASGNDEGVVIDDFVIQDGILGVNDLEHLKQSVILYPNPSAGKYVVTWKNSYDNIKIEIFDISGKMILKKTNIPVENNRYNLDMSKYSAGFYYVKIKLDDTNISKKIILK